MTWIANRLRDCCWGITESFFEYVTPRVTAIRSWRIASLYRFIQLTLMFYVIGYVIVYKKGYQDFETAYGSVSTKLKGAVITDLKENLIKVWDPPDYVIPPMDIGGFFVMTNVLITHNQTQDLCPEFPDVPGAICSPAHNMCDEGKTLYKGHGTMTGNCISYSQDSEPHTCQIAAWCPVENDTMTMKKPVLEQAENFTVFIKNFVHFPTYRVKKRNIVEHLTAKDLEHCLYHPKHDAFCPIFRIGDMGGVVRIVIEWDCNLDYNLKYCVPKYEFHRLDHEHEVSPGWNFRFTKEFINEKGRHSRDHYKAFGILFLVSVVGRAGKFSIIELTMKLGSGVALLALARVVCDFMLLYIHRRRALFQQHKYYRVIEDDIREYWDRRRHRSRSSEETRTIGSMRVPIGSMRATTGSRRVTIPLREMMSDATSTQSL